MRVKAKLLGTSRYSNDPAEKKVVFPISLFHLNQEGDKLKATLDLIEREFSDCDVIIADTLQRHNFLLDHPLAQALEISHKAGTLWIERNIHLFDAFKIPFNIVRWNSCLGHPGFKSALDQIQSLYHQNILLQQALNQDIYHFIERNPSRNSESYYLEHCKNYLFEETAVILSYFFEKKYKYLIYPATIPKFIEFFVQGQLKNLKIYFKKIREKSLIL